MPARRVLRRSTSTSPARSTPPPRAARHPPLRRMRAGEVEVDRLKTRRAGIGDIGRKNFLAIAAQRENLAKKIKSGVDCRDHHRSLDLLSPCLFTAAASRCSTLVVPNVTSLVLAEFSFFAMMVKTWLTRKGKLRWPSRTG